MSSSEWDPWNLRNELTPGLEPRNLIGFKVHASDGHIGKVDSATLDQDKSEIVVDTGPWIFGRLVILPGGTIERVDFDEESVYVDLTKDQIKASPEVAVNDDYESSRDDWDDHYRGTLAGYYGGFYGPGNP